MPASDSPSTSKVEEVMARVRASLSAQTDRGSPSSVTRYRPGEDNVFPEDVYRSLHQARTIGGALSVDHDLGWRTPIIGHLWLVVRRRIHQEIRIYIDSLSTQQSSLNVQLIRALTTVVETLDRLGLRALGRGQELQEANISQLAADVHQLHAQIEEMRARLSALEQQPVVIRDPTPT